MAHQLLVVTMGVSDLPHMADCLRMLSSLEANVSYKNFDVFEV